MQSQPPAHRIADHHLRIDRNPIKTTIPFPQVSPFKASPIRSFPQHPMQGHVTHLTKISITITATDSSKTKSFSPSTRK